MLEGGQMHRIRRLIAAAIIVTAAIVATDVVSTTTTAHAAIITAPGYYKVSYSDDIYLYTNYGRGFPRTRRIDFNEWAAAGFPAPQLAQSDVVKYPWSPTLYAVTFFDGDWEWRRLSFDEWARMGFQQPRNAGWIEGSVIGKLGSSDELFLSGEDGSLHKLTFDEWAATGFQPVLANWSNIGFVRFRNSPEIFLAFNYRTANEVGVGISFAEWASYAFPTPEVR